MVTKVTTTRVSACLDWTLARRSPAKEGWTFPMFPLHTATFPSSAAELQRLLNESLERVFISKTDPVTVGDRSFPRLSRVEISLDGSRLRPEPPRPSIATGKVSPALEIDRLNVSASPLSVGPAELHLSLAASEVRLGQGKDANEQIVLSLQSATEGNIEISILQSDLTALVTGLAQDQAGKQGITIDGVNLQLRQENAHSLAVEVRLRARKLFLAASLRITGQLDLDDQLNVKISGLNCTGDGGMAAMACGILKPYLEKFDGREFSLMSLPLGEISLRNVRLTVDDDLIITAEFGSAS